MKTNRSRANRRQFLQGTTGLLTAACLEGRQASTRVSTGSQAHRIQNHYDLFLPGEREALDAPLAVAHIVDGQLEAAVGSERQALHPGESIEGWRLLTVARMNGTATAVFEKSVTHAGVIAYVTEGEGVIARIPLGIGDLSQIRPRAVAAPENVQLQRQNRYAPGPDAAGHFILASDDDPCYENVAALGAEYIGWSLVANEESGPLRSLYLEADGTSRQTKESDPQSSWAPDLTGRLFDPRELLPGDNPQIFAYVPGYSKRTLLGGYLPAAHTGVWNPHHRAGYEVMVILPPGADSRPMARVRAVMPDSERKPKSFERFWNANAASFFSALAGIWNRWYNFVEEQMPVEIPDRWLLNAARAGIVLSRCSYRGLEPTYQIGEGAYTKIPERSHALFPVAFYEFIWAHQLWNMTAQAEPYFAHYLDKYILPDGNFLYNTQDQVEAPMNVGVFLANAAREYEYSGDFVALDRKLPALRRTLGYVLERYEYSRRKYRADDRRFGLIWGSPEADLGDPRNDYPQSHPLYYQNAVWTWRGLNDFARCLKRAADEHHAAELVAEAQSYLQLAARMRGEIERSLHATVAAGSDAMRQAKITPFTPDDIHREPKQLSSYENHRFMMDWFTADWGDAALDRGHLLHRKLAGLQILGLGTDGESYRVSNFMEHGTLAALIREDDYRPFLLALYGLTTFAADSGNRYSPEDAYIPGSFPGDGNPYGWSSVVNSALQPTLGLRWLLCYEDNHQDICHLQKAAPKHWFARGQSIVVKRCPTRFGEIAWSTRGTGDSWNVSIECREGFTADLVLHIHPVDGAALKSATLGAVSNNSVTIPKALLGGKPSIIHFNVR